MGGRRAHSYLAVHPSYVCALHLQRRAFVVGRREGMRADVIRYSLERLVSERHRESGRRGWLTVARFAGVRYKDCKLQIIS